MPKMGGPFYTKSHELHDQLKELGRGFNEFYDNIVREAIVWEHWEEDRTIWVRGTFRASKADLRKWASGISRSSFQRCWAKIIESKIIEDNGDGSFGIPRYKKRGDEGIREGEVKMMSQDLQQTKQEVGEIKEDLQSIKEILQSGIDPSDRENPGEEDAKPVKNGSRPVKTGAKPVKTGAKPVTGDRPHPFKGQKDIDNYEEEGKSAPPGSREWIKKQIDNLWPGRGFKPELDADYLEALEEFSAPELEAAFGRARADKVKYGNYDYILNFLRNPKLYEKKRRGKKKKRKSEGKDDLKWIEGDKHIGGLKADWLNEESEDEEPDEES